MKKRLFSLLLCITVLFSTVLVVEASATTGTMTDTEMQKMYDFIFSEETNKLINSSIDFNQYGTQTVNIGNDLAYVYINERSATRSVVSDTMTSIFKKISFVKTTTAVLIGSIIYKACVAIALKNFEPQDMKLITAVLFLVILVLSMERKKKVKKNAGA